MAFHRARPRSKTSDRNAADYDFSHVPASATEIHGFSPRRLAADARFRELLDNISLGNPAASMMFDPRIEQVLLLKVSGIEYSFLTVLTVADGTALDLLKDQVWYELFPEFADLTWQNVIDQTATQSTRGDWLQILDSKTLLLSASKEPFDEYSKQVQQLRDVEFLAVTARLNKDEHAIFSLAQTIEGSYLSESHTLTLELAFRRSFDDSEDCSAPPHHYELQIHDGHAFAIRRAKSRG